jgi:hypothetical protein
LQVRLDYFCYKKRRVAGQAVAYGLLVSLVLEPSLVLFIASLSLNAAFSLG